MYGMNYHLNDSIERCENSSGYIHIFCLRFIVREDAFLDCLQVFGSSNVVVPFLSTTDRLITLPFMTLAPYVATRRYEVTNCASAFSQMRVFTLFYAVNHPGYLQTVELFDELYYTTEDGELEFFQHLLETAMDTFQVGLAVTDVIDLNH